MCVSLGPAKFSNTILYVGSAVRDGKDVHVLGYQNTAENLAVAGRPPGLDPRLWSQVIREQGAKPVGNAMILPFPAIAAMGEANVVDTSGCKSILKDIVTAVKPRSKGGTLMGGDRSMSFSAPIVFETGIYTVVLARDPRDIPAALAHVPEEKRPDLKPEIFAAYAEWYPGWQIALCCFSNADAVEADPLLWWYEPAFPDVYFAPALDSHTGGVPDLDATVDVDHAVTFMSTEGRAPSVEYADTLSDEVRALLPTHAIGRELDTRLPNGDFQIDKATADAGRFTIDRIKPGANPRIELRSSP